MTDARVCFLRGVMGRSGTNFLHDVLLRHPGTGHARHLLYEDFLTVESDRLLEYVGASTSWWPTKWPIDRAAESRTIERALGSALTRYIADDDPRLVLTKTPDPTGIEHHLRLFGEAPLVLLVRDPRSVIESAVRSFTAIGSEQDRFEWALHRWAAGATTIRAFADAHDDGRGRWWHLVRYEDLVTNLQGTLEPVLRVLDLDPEQFNWEAAANTPVRGSSSFGVVEGRAQWDTPVARDESFDPLNRWADWPEERHFRVARVAGGAMRHFGYEPAAPDSGSVLLHAAAEARFRVRALVRRTGKNERTDAR